MDRLTVSANGHFLVTESGNPFFWLGDTAWGLFHRCTREDAAFYLQTRQRQGYNVILACTLFELENGMPNAYGHMPFVDNDPLQPNDPYFKHVDWIIDLAAQNNMYVGLLPTWGDRVHPAWGTPPFIFDVNTAKAYGEWIGKRYRDDENVVWIMGGDRQIYKADHDYSPIWRAMAKGIRSQSDALMTFHPKGWEGSSETFHHQSWLDMNMWQSGHSGRDTPIWEWITNDYNKTPSKPVLDGEPNYEDHPIDPFSRPWKPIYGRFDAFDVRKQAYRAVFAGACGHTYGHHAVWQFYAPPYEPINFPEPNWRTALEQPGAQQMVYLRRLMERFPYLTRIPDQQLIASDAGTGCSHMRATRDHSGSWAMIYIPQEEYTFQINWHDFKQHKVNAAWYNPRTGDFQTIESMSASNTFTTPASGSDWVLVLTTPRENEY